jgi:hypothetical protein
MNLERRLVVLASCIVVCACSLQQRPLDVAQSATISGNFMTASPVSSPAPPLQNALWCVKHEAPPFPDQAILAKVAEGHVRAVMTIDEKGMVADVRIVSSDPPGVFDDSVRDTLLKWQCAAKGSKYRASVQINFALKGEPPQTASGKGVTPPSSSPSSNERQERDVGALTPAIGILVNKYEAAQAVAPVPDAERVALAREIIDVSGTREKIALVASPERVKKTIGGQPASSRVPSKLRDAIVATFLASYRSDRVLASLERGLAATLDSATLRVGLGWEQSKLGRTIDHLELEAEKPGLRATKKEFVEQFIKRGGAPDDARARACEQEAALDNSAEAMLPVLEAGYTAAGMMAFAMKGQTPDMDAIQRFIVGVRPVLRDAARQAGLAECLFSLRDLSDADFDKWLEFLRTDSGGRYARGVNTALRKAYLEAAEVYARTLVDVARQLKGSGGT